MELARLGDKATVALLTLRRLLVRVGAVAGLDSLRLPLDDDVALEAFFLLPVVVVVVLRDLVLVVRIVEGTEDT